jgi:diguanylate cyclase (GGDEF)-like protein
MLEKSQLALNPELEVRDESSHTNHADASERSSGQTHDSLLIEANQELANLLQDYRDIPPPTPDSSPESQHVRELLSRAVQCTLKQYTLQGELKAQSCTDELTGLYNRRGFLSLAEQQFKLASRAQRAFTLFFVDVDGLKQINDKFGHSTGDLALICTAEALTATFRKSDILGRLGGDEFAALAVDSSGDHESAIATRLSEKLKCLNSSDARYMLSLSVGAVRYDPGSTLSIKELIHLADQAMYRVKKTCRSRERVIPFPCPSEKVLEWSRRPSHRHIRSRHEPRPMA